MCAADAPPPTPHTSDLQQLNLQPPAFITIPIARKTLRAITETHIHEQHLQETPQKTAVSNESLQLSKDFS
jgi:hypothetical protein